MPYGDELVWVGSTGLVYTLPSYRIAGLYAPANGEVSTPSFVVPSGRPLWINAAAKWKGHEVTGGCDEGCDACVLVAVLDAATGAEVEGYGMKDVVAMADIDGLRLVLQWKGSGSAVVNSTALAGRQVRLRIYFRDATVFAVGCRGQLTGRVKYKL